MLDRADWDLYWRWELHRRACDPLDARRWKRDSSRALRELFPGPDVALLDSTCGLGDHTLNLAELGFRTEGCDASPVAREASERALAAAGLSVPIFDARWETLGRDRPARYDLIFNDVLHWIYDSEALHAALVGMRDALRPGGALVYFFADADEPEEGAGRRVLEWDWERMARAELCWEHERDGTRVALSLVNERGDDYVDQHHLYLVHEGDAPPRLDTLTMRRVYRWDWHALSAAMRRAGFGELRSRKFRNTKGYDFALNLAFRPA